MGSPRRVYGTLLAGKNARLSGYEVWGPVHTHPDSQQAVARQALRNASLPDHRHGAPGGPVFFVLLIIDIIFIAVLLHRILIDIIVIVIND